MGSSTARRTLAASAWPPPASVTTSSDANQVESAGGRAPLSARYFLIGRDHDVPRLAGGKVTYYRSFDVCDRLHRIGLTIRSDRIADYS